MFDGQFKSDVQSNIQYVNGKFKVPKFTEEVIINTDETLKSIAIFCFSILMFKKKTFAFHVSKGNSP